ncbi:FtsW/RodA/SpoVE family cell cycle protein [uncultured Clostridium sp.]|uniref:FtsW/RodA/SpoVE family cell cycle protein n=1 Tax=uncultured Clostridium sp. TaxID=59620 RepID=UPI0032179CB7
MSTVNHPKIEKYIEEVCELIKNRRVHENIKDELIDHIEEIIEDYRDVGLTEEEAIDKALMQMGSSEAIGRDLNKVHKAAPDWILLGITGLFILVGIFTLGFIQKNNASSSMVDFNFLGKTIIYALGGIILAAFLLKIDYRKFKKYSKYLYGGVIILLLYQIVSGHYLVWTIGQMFGPIRSYTKDIIVFPFFLIIALAGIFDRWNWKDTKSILKGIIIAFVPTIFFIIGKDSESIIIYTIAAVTLMIISGLKLKHIIISFGVIGPITLFYMFSEPYAIEGLQLFFNPSLDPIHGIGGSYDLLVVLRESAGLFGQGANFTRGMLPEVHTDFIFTYIVYSFGWIVGIILISLILAFIIRIGIIGKSTKESYGKLLVSGLCVLFVVQFLLSISVSLMLSPAVSVNMPFIGYGASQFLINITAISIVSNVHKWRNTPYNAKIQ